MGNAVAAKVAPWVRKEDTLTNLPPPRPVAPPPPWDLLAEVCAVAALPVFSLLLFLQSVQAHTSVREVRSYRTHSLSCSYLFRCNR